MESAKHTTHVEKPRFKRICVFPYKNGEDGKPMILLRQKDDDKGKRLVGFGGKNNNFSDINILITGTKRMFAQTKGATLDKVWDEANKPSTEYEWKLNDQRTRDMLDKWMNKKESSFLHVLDGPGGLDCDFTVLY